MMRENTYNGAVGNLDIWVDEIVPCLKDTETGELKETVVFKVETRSFLKDYNKKNGWHINWYDIAKNEEVYVLALKENMSVQGLVALHNDQDARAVYMAWACTAPHNNKHDYGAQKYSGVGGHLFAIAADKSREWGYGGAVHGFAANKELFDHYINVFNAQALCLQHMYQIFINEIAAAKLLEVYSYEWDKDT